MTWFQYGTRLVWIAVGGLLLATCSQNHGQPRGAVPNGKTQVQLVKFPAGQAIEQLTIERPASHRYG
jgi:hypothetical protein